MAACVQQERTKTGGPWECSLAMPALEADPSHTPGVGRTQGQAFPTAPANGPASSCSCSTPPLLPMEIPQGQSQPATAAPCAPSHEQKHQPPTCAMDPAPAMGLAEGSRSRAVAELTPARSGAQLVPEHGRAPTGATPEPGDTQRGHGRPIRPGAAGSSRGQGCSRMLCARLGSATAHPGGNAESEHDISFPPPPPPRRAGGGPGPRASTSLQLFGSRVPGSACCGKSCIPSEPLKQREGP